MKNYLTALFFLISLTLVSGQEMTKTTHATLTVHLTGISSDKGQVLVALYADEKQWLATLYKGEKSKIVDGKATVVFKNVPGGSYGISAFHDENSNGDLDSNFLGIPKEDYACSRGAKGMFGPPKWEDAVLEINSTTEINIKF